MEGRIKEADKKAKKLKCINLEKEAPFFIDTKKPDPPVIQSFWDDLYSGKHNNKTWFEAWENNNS